MAEDLGAWSRSRPCPVCKGTALLVYTFKKFGRHTLVACENCRVIRVDGDVAEKLTLGDADPSPVSRLADAKPA